MMGVTEMQGKQSRLLFSFSRNVADATDIELRNSQKCTSFKKRTYSSVLGDCF